MSQSSYFVHHDSSIFPNPTKFDPDRWVKAAKSGQNLKRFLVTFSRGSRSCLGMNLAYCELYLVIATICNRFEMELYNTTAEDVIIKRDLAVSQPAHGRFRVDVMVTGSLERSAA